MTIGIGYELALFQLLEITGRETGIFALKFGKIHFGFMELQISDVSIAQSDCSRRVFEVAESIYELKK
jgi:hypothetical protein